MSKEPLDMFMKAAGMMGIIAADLGDQIHHYSENEIAHLKIGEHEFEIPWEYFKLMDKAHADEFYRREEIANQQMKLDDFWKEKQ